MSTLTIKKCPGVCGRSTVERWTFKHQGRLTQQQAQDLTEEAGYLSDTYNLVSFHHEEGDVAVWMCFSRPV